MKQKNQVVLNLQELSVPDKLQKAEGFMKAITGNRHFSNTDGLLTKIKEAAAPLQAAYSEAMEARSVSITKTAVLKQQEDVLDNTLTAMARYVEMESMGDEAVIKSAGMDIKTKSVPIGIPGIPEGLSAAEGAKTGSILLKWKSVRGAKSYVIRTTITIADAASWQQGLVVTKAAAAAEGLVSGKQYWFQVAAVGAAGQGPWSDPATKVAP